MAEVRESPALGGWQGLEVRRLEVLQQRCDMADEWSSTNVKLRAARRSERMRRSPAAVIGAGDTK